STGTIALALFVLGCFLLLTVNLDRLAGEWSRSAELSVYLADEASEAERLAVQATLAAGPIVASVEAVSKEAALARFKQMFGDLASAADALEGNPIPASFEVRLQAGASPTAVQALAAALREAPGVADVRYDREWLDRLVAAVSLVRRVGFLLGGILTLAAAFTVANVVRLALYGRRDEIDIMQLVGAPTAYVRGPFVMEGVLQGGVGALVALSVLAGAYLAAQTRYLVPLAATLNLSRIQFLSVELSLLLLTGGMAVGCLGGYLASRTRS
ncbi:MAG: cell division protein FtsX, partial [Vicinamibacterales bacterium]